MPLNNTDYYRSFMDLYDLLPDVYKSDTNRSTFYNSFNRFLTKNEVRKVAGYIGEPNKNAILRRQIEEDTIHRQAYQLQPILNTMIGSVKHFAAWKDIKKELERLGVDIERMDEWGAAQKFNWVPPVDIDKLINYFNYYWVDSKQSDPEYITMKSRCAVAISLVHFWEKIIEDNGSDVDITGILTYTKEADYPIFTVDSIVGSLNTVIAKGNVFEYLKDNDFFYIQGTKLNNGKHRIDDISYDIKSDTSTIIAVPGTIDNTSYEVVGSIVTHFYNKISVDGNLAHIFTKDFVFFIKDSPNEELNLSFWKSTGSEYKEDSDETIITLHDIFTDSASGGIVSFDEQYQIALSTKACICTETAEWDNSQWDDNPIDPLWGGFIPGLHAEWLSEVSNSAPPPNTYATEQWYDTNADILYGWNNSNDEPSYEIITRNFSFLLNQTQGVAFWDETSSCSESYKSGTADQWIEDNKWIHYKDVTDFTTAKKAQLPIIEYQWDIALNEWSEITHLWKYRSLSTDKWVETESKPEMIELIPLELWDIGPASNAIELDERYGDLTDTFVVGYKFTTLETNETFEVLDSYYSRKSDIGHFSTKVIIDKIVIHTDLIPGNIDIEEKSTTPIIPILTSKGNDWKRYGDHWLYVGTEEIKATQSRARNLLIDPPKEAQFIEDPSGDFEYKLMPYSQTMRFKVDEYSKEIYFIDASFNNSTRGLNRKALLGNNDVRLYINGERKYGSFNEIGYFEEETGISYVGGIKLLDFMRLSLNDEIIIEVGEGAQQEVGLYGVPVRIHEKNNDHKNFGNAYISLISYKHSEQIKTKENQYPIFDIFNPVGTHSGKANHIFGFRTSSDAPANNIINQRIVYESASKVYDFEQYLINEDDGPMYAYRDYSNLTNNYWYDPEINTLFFWVDGCWANKTLMGNHYREAYISSQEPGYKEQSINGLFWYDTANNELKVRDAINQEWDVIDDVIISYNDNTLQTIWRSGEYKEYYVPEKVDWDKRTIDEYDTEKITFIENTYPELMEYYPEMTEEEAKEEANNLWYEKESNPHSPSGLWIGDWELPDQLYFNHMHENRKVINSAELRVHFQTIIENQQPIPGYTGNIADMFRLIPINDVNYGVGGTIHEYNDGFDTFLSSAFVDNVTPISLIDFAASQYEVLLINSVIDVYRQNVVGYLTDTSLAARSDMSEFIAESVINQHAQNDYFNVVYGDTTAYDDKENKGIPNWIATLPYVNLMHAKRPSKLIDKTRGVDELRHHDGHFAEYGIHLSEEANIIKNLINTEDTRTDGETWGKSGTSLPPDNMTEFVDIFNTIENRNGVYCHKRYQALPDRQSGTLYRFNVVSSGSTKPLGIFEDGALWFDTDDEVLKIKKTTPENYPVWEIVDGLSEGDGRLHNGTDPSDITTARISAWEEIEMSILLVDALYHLEMKLYENAPDEPIRYDINEARNIDPIIFDKYLEDAFLDFVTEYKIVNPFSNTEYVIDDPWTWNYKHCIPGGGYSIIESDNVNSTFHILGDHQDLFDPCYYSGYCPSQVSFYIKNSIVNDGKWNTQISDGKNPIAFYEYDIEKKQGKTIVSVEGEVAPSVEGFIYLGLLPGYNSTGSESASYWKNYYRELYETPYPHLEPWKLQGYGDQPEWWNEEYLNNDSLKWGSRRWQYKHGFEIKEFANIFGRGTYIIEGEFLDVFIPGEVINVDSSDLTENFTHTVSIIHSIDSIDKNLSSIEIDDDFEYFYTNDKVIGIIDADNNYIGSYRVKNSEYIGPPTLSTIIYLEENDIPDIEKFSAISSVYYISENQTIIQTDESILPQTFNEEIQHGRIAKAFGMWENIRIGAIPPGKAYPNGIISETGNPVEDRKIGIKIEDLEKWHYFSVNIDNSSRSTDSDATSYLPDDLLPPYWDHYSAIGIEREEGAPNSTPVNLFDSPLRSVFSDYLGEIIAPSADYTFGDGGPVEWEWRKSSRYLFDTLKASYRIDPVRYVCHTFGINFYIIDDLQIDTKTNNTFSHNRTNFHGDIVDDKTQKYQGTNQWYVNFNRYLSFDNNFAEFANMWKRWEAPMSYQFATFVDTPSLQVAHRHIPFTKYDYSIATKRSPGVSDFWMDAFRMSITKIPPDIMRYDTQNEWGIEINTHVSVSRNIKYYDVQNYQFYVNPETDTAIIYTWAIKEVDVYNKFFEIEGNQVFYFDRDTTFTVHSSSGNDGLFTVYKSVFNDQINRTILEVYEPISSIIGDGLATLNSYRSLPWETGEKIHLCSTETLPSPFVNKTSKGLNEYYFIKINPFEFQIADAKEDAFAGNNIDILSIGRGDHFIGKIHSLFKSLKTATSGLKTDIDWIHYEMDDTRLLNVQLPTTINGMQNLINFIDGYFLYTKKEGWRINDQNSMSDRITNRLVSWQGEMEKFIDYAYTIRAQQYASDDKYEITVDPEENLFEFVGDNPLFATGNKIKFLSNNGSYPEPVYRYTDYNFVYVDGKRFKIAATKRDAEVGKVIDIFSNYGVDKLFIHKPKDKRHEYPRTGLNPFRNAIWFRHPKGVVSNVISGPTEDIRTVQTVVDQYGRRVDIGNIRVFREDRRTQISVKNEIPNMIEPPYYYIYQGDYDYIHIGGIHLFLDTYEHVMILNDYTTDGDLIYDPFIGMNATKFEMLFNRQIDFTQRPNIGGYYFHSKNNIESDLIGNIEQGVESLRYAYDTFNILESNKMAQEVRKSIGYSGIKDYLSLININEKSQFLFWRGFIHQKGTTRSIDAYLNSRRFVDAKVDEFWAAKIADFGSNRDKEYIEMYVNTDDLLSDESGLEFIDTDTTLGLLPPGLIEPPIEPTEPPSGDCRIIQNILPIDIVKAGETNFTLPFFVDFGDLLVYINGVKITSYNYRQKTNTEIIINNPILSVYDVLDVGMLITTACDSNIHRKATIFNNVKGQTDFETDFECNLGNLNIFVNGARLSSDMYTQTESNEFTLTNEIISNMDIIEAESWVSDNIKIVKHSKTFTELDSEQRSFSLIDGINIDGITHNYIVYINGLKMSNNEFTSKGPSGFTIKEGIMSTGDAVEAEWWVSNEVI